MREIVLERVVDAPPSDVLSRLSPQQVVASEGSFTVDAVEATDEGPVVVASGPGLQLRLLFEDLENGIYYTQDEEAGPFKAMETWITVDPLPEEPARALLRYRSAVSLRLPLPFADRIAAWKRRGEVERALDALAADVEHAG